MNKIIYEHVEASALPDSLRGSLPAGARVRVTIEEEAPPKSLSFAELRNQIESMKAAPDFQPVHPDEAVRRIRALRDEWDD